MTTVAPAFDPSTFQDLAQKIVDFVEKVAGKINEFLGAVNDLLDSWVLRFLGAVKDAIKWVAQKIVDLAEWVLDKIKVAARAIAAPITFWTTGSGWGDHVQTPSSAVAAVVQPNALRAPLDWTGDAANRYKTAVSLQGPAATSVSSIAGTVSMHMKIAAGGGLVFYAAMVAVAVKFVSVMTAATAATATGVGAPPGLGAAAVEAGTDAAVVAGAIAAVTALIGSQVSSIANITNAANNQGAFPNNAWPVGTA